MQRTERGRMGLLGRSEQEQDLVTKRRRLSFLDSMTSTDTPQTSRGKLTPERGKLDAEPDEFLDVVDRPPRGVPFPLPARARHVQTPHTATTRVMNLIVDFEINVNERNGITAVRRPGIPAGILSVLQGGPKRPGVPAVAGMPNAGIRILSVPQAR